MQQSTDQSDTDSLGQRSKCSGHAGCYSETVFPFAGIGLSNDKVLQTRALSYSDTQRYRIGTNYQMLPINAPKCPFHNTHENGTQPHLLDKSLP